MAKLYVGYGGEDAGGATGRRGQIRAMPTFTLEGVQYDYLAPMAGGDPEGIYSYEQIIVRWLDDGENAHAAWITKDNVRRLTASEWDIMEYCQCPPELRNIRLGKRPPGFLPECIMLSERHSASITADGDHFESYSCRSCISHCSSDHFMLCTGGHGARHFNTVGSDSAAHT